jgi:hypothetical protein
MQTRLFSLFKAIVLFVIFITVAACSSDGDDTDRDADANASYKVTFTGLWTAADFPTGFPGGGAHFTTLVGGTHNDQVIFWEPGQPATQGIENMAESGSTGVLSSEVEAAKTDGKAEFVLLGSGNTNAAATSTFEFDINETYPLVTLTSMVAPSPDWFVGVHGLSLFDDAAGDWKQTVTVELNVYDAGTEDGVSFSRSNPDSSGSIALLTSNPTDTDFINGVGLGGKFIATMTFERIK